MDNKGADAKHSKEVVRVSGMKINPGQRHYMMLERNAPGYIGTTIICPGGTMSSLRYKVSSWADESSLDAWENSQQYLELIEEANKFSTRYHERGTGLGF